MSQINAYINFPGNAREAMTFYKECLGGELDIQTVAGSPIAENMPPDAGQLVMHSMLTSGGVLLMGSDMVIDGLIQGNNVSLMLSCDSEEEINAVFAKLSAGGNVTHPLGDSFWGSIFGHFTDRFGIHWSVNYDKTPK